MANIELKTNVDRRDSPGYGFGMGQHNTGFGDLSTDQANRKLNRRDKGTPGYQGAHRKSEVQGINLTGKISDRIRKGQGGDWQHESQRDSQ